MRGATPRIDHRWWRVGGLWLMLASAPAFAQWDGQVEWLSDERYRGLSLSEHRPAWRASLNVDHDSGLYGGAQASTDVSLASRNRRYRLYGGFAQAFSGASLSWEAGLQGYRNEPGQEYRPYSFLEPYLGLHGQGWHLRWTHADRYLGMPLSAHYAEINAARGLGAGWTLQGHAGVLHLSGPPPANHDTRMPRDADQLDLRLSLSTQWDRWRMAVSGDASASSHLAQAHAAVALGLRF